jgi:hypothetical protein
MQVLVVELKYSSLSHVVGVKTVEGVKSVVLVCAHELVNAPECEPYTNLPYLKAYKSSKQQIEDDRTVF